ncbi:MAG: hypothetical protein JWP99_1243 [Devosia sp.]|nr:hypothetical protein [Devosia sp.]
MSKLLPAMVLLLVGLAAPSLAAGLSQGANAAATKDKHDARIDMLMTCGAGFILSAQSLEETGQEADAAMLEQLGTNLINAGEELMVQSGLAEEARFQISKMYGEQVGKKMRAGEDLSYDWDTCAAIDY